MEKESIILQIEVGRLEALNFFLAEQQHSSVRAELEKALDELYEKHVPEDTRRFIRSKMKQGTVGRKSSRRKSSQEADVEPEENE